MRDFRNAFPACPFRLRDRAVVILRRDKPAYISTVQGNCTLFNGVPIIPFGNDHITGIPVYICNSPDVIRVPGIISGSAVLPVIKNSVARLRDIVVVFLPYAHFFSRFDQIITTDFDRHDCKVIQFDRQRRPSTRTPRPPVHHFSFARKFVCRKRVVYVYDRLVGSVRFLFPYPTISQINDTLSAIHCPVSLLILFQAFVPFCQVMRPYNIHIIFYIPGRSGIRRRFQFFQVFFRRVLLPDRLITRIFQKIIISPDA